MVAGLQHSGRRRSGVAGHGGSSSDGWAGPQRTSASRLAGSGQHTELPRFKWLPRLNRLPRLIGAAARALQLDIHSLGHGGQPGPSLINLLLGCIHANDEQLTLNAQEELNTFL